MRDDLTQPVPADQWEQLARNSLGQLDKSNFIYDAERNVYHCPGGRELPYESRENRNGVERMRYRSLNCDGCPLVALCLQKKKDGEPATGADGRVRNIRRDAHTDVRERAAQRMVTPESKAQYARRSPIAETPFAWLKGVLGLRQFRHVGLEKVETEWRWACLPDHEPEKDPVGAVTTASPGRVVRNRAADHRNRPGSVIREKSQT